MEQITHNQIELLKKLLNGRFEENQKEILSMSKKDAFVYIDTIIKSRGHNTEKVETKDLNKEYPIAFQAMVKAACELYKNRTDKSFKDVLEEVKSVY